MADETDILTDHEYDGIQEFDNPLPRWWLATFAATVIFTLGYWIVFHSLPTDKGTFAAHAFELAEHEKILLANSISEEDLIKLAGSPEAIERGRVVFDQQCASCHLEDGSGKIGPNLTDRYWLHGRTPRDIWVTVNLGVTEKGMPAWRNLLGKSVDDVTAYVLSISDDDLPGREPQGVDANGEAP